MQLPISDRDRVYKFDFTLRICLRRGPKVEEISMARARTRSRSYSPRHRSRSPPRERKSYDDNRHRERLSSRDHESSDPSGLLIRNLPLDARSPFLSLIVQILSSTCVDFHRIVNLKTFFKQSWRAWLDYICTISFKCLIVFVFRPNDLRDSFERFGPLKDIYLPRNYYTGYVIRCFELFSFIGVLVSEWWASTFKFDLIMCCGLGNREDLDLLNTVMLKMQLRRWSEWITKLLVVVR